MKLFAARSTSLISLFTLVVLAGCSTPTLVEMARRRTKQQKDDVTVKYTVTDLDVLNFTDEVKRKLANRSSFHTGVRYGSTGAQATLGSLAGAAQIFGWSTATASGLGLGATYIFGLGQIFDSKAHAQAYEQACSAIQAAEASYYFQQLGMGFTTDSNGKKIADPKQGGPNGEIPSQTFLTPAGETLYYRTTKILKVLDDALVSKIPDLEDLKEANGESSASGSPSLQKTSEPSVTPPPAADLNEFTRKPVVRITPTPKPAKDARKLANQILRDANFLDDEHAKGVITTAGAYQELEPELSAKVKPPEQMDRDYLFHLIDSAVTDKNGMTELTKWRAIIPVHPVGKPSTPKAGVITPPGASPVDDTPPAGTPPTKSN